MTRECRRNTVEDSRVEAELTPTQPPKILEDIPEGKEETSEEKKNCEECFMSGLPSDHDKSDED